MNKKLDEFNNKLRISKIALIGVGVSNLPLLDYLYNLECDVTIFSEKEIDMDISKYNYKIYNGTNCLSKLHGFDIIFRSPSCLPTRKELVDAKKEGAYITTEIMEVIKLSPSKIIGVTGSDGKTTTTTLIDLMLRENGYRTFLGGNIGNPLFTRIGEMTKDDIVVLELSSFQLMDMSVSPDISVITNISPNHLDIHKDYQEYIDSKFNIFKHKDGILVINKDDDILNKIECNREIRYFSSNEKTNSFYLGNDLNIYYDDKMIINTSELHIRGKHNYLNICTSLSSIYDMIDIDKTINVIKEFNGVEHRIEFVREINNVKWYNDSVSSSPTRLLAGINSFSENIILIAGGYDKNLDYSPVADDILKKVRVLILFGATKDKIYKAVMDKKKDEQIDIYVLNTLEEVVNKAYEVAHEDDIVLFSPGSASFDIFKNFMDRGNKFKELVNKL